MNHSPKKQEAGGTSSDSHIWSYTWLTDIRAHYTGKAPHCSSCRLPIWGWVKHPQWKYTNSSQMSLGKSGLPQTFSTTLTHVVSAHGLLGERGLRLRNPLSPHASLLPPQQQLVCGKYSKETEKKKKNYLWKKIIHFAIILLELPKSFNLQTSNGLTVHLQSFCCSVSLFSAKELAGCQSSV